MSGSIRIYKRTGILERQLPNYESFGQIFGYLSTYITMVYNFMGKNEITKEKYDIKISYQSYEHFLLLNVTFFGNIFFTNYVTEAVKYAPTSAQHLHITTQT